MKKKMLYLGKSSLKHKFISNLKCLKTQLNNMKMHEVLNRYRHLLLRTKIVFKKSIALN